MEPHHTCHIVSRLGAVYNAISVLIILFYIAMLMVMTMPLHKCDQWTTDYEGPDPFALRDGFVIEGRDAFTVHPSIPPPMHSYEVLIVRSPWLAVVIFCR